MGKKRFEFILLAIGIVIVIIVLSGCIPSTFTYSVSGYVTYNGSGLSGVTISFNDGLPSVTTNTSGYWSQSGLTGSVVVTPSLSGYTFTPSSTTVTGPNSNVNFTGTKNVVPPNTPSNPSPSNGQTNVSITPTFLPHKISPHRRSLIGT